MVSLLEIKKNKTVKIEEIDGTDEQKSRLSELGFIPGSITSLIAKLPFNGPLALVIRGSKFALRRDDAACILVSST